MPSINSSLSNVINTAGLIPVAPPPPPESIHPVVQRNMFCRCPVPQISNVSPDTISQSNLHGTLPQYRVWISS